MKKLFSIGFASLFLTATAFGFCPKKQCNCPFAGNATIFTKDFLVNYEDEKEIIRYVSKGDTINFFTEYCNRNNLKLKWEYSAALLDCKESLNQTPFKKFAKLSCKVTKDFPNDAETGSVQAIFSNTDRDGQTIKEIPSNIIYLAPDSYELKDYPYLFKSVRSRKYSKYGDYNNKYFRKAMGNEYRYKQYRGSPYWRENYMNFQNLPEIFFTNPGFYWPEYLYSDVRSY